MPSRTRPNQADSLLPNICCFLWHVECVRSVRKKSAGAGEKGGLCHRRGGCVGGGFGRGTVTGTKLAACLASSATTSSAAVCGKAGAESSTTRGVKLFHHGSDAMFAVTHVQKANLVFML